LGLHLRPLAVPYQKYMSNPLDVETLLGGDVGSIKRYWQLVCSREAEARGREGQAHAL
jgi:hypothetical protein